MLLILSSLKHFIEYGSQISDCGEGKKKAEIFSDAITSRDKRELNRSKRDETENSERYFTKLCLI